MTASEAIARAQETRQGSIDYSQFLKWVNVIEGRVQIEVMDKKPDELIIYTEENDNVQLLIPHPYDEVYIYYLCAMIDFFNEEWDLYANDAAFFEKAFDDYKGVYLKSMPGTSHQIHGWWKA